MARRIRIAKSKRYGMGKGTGSGYRNMIPKDPSVHSQSAKGMKQAKQYTLIPLQPQKDPEEMSWEEIKRIHPNITAQDLVIESAEPDFMGEQIEGAEIDENGNIYFVLGFEDAVRQVGGVKLNKEQQKKLLEKINLEKPKNDEELYDALSAYQGDNTYNYDPPLHDTINYGFIEHDLRTYFVFKKHLGGDVRGNYTDYYVYDITDVDLGATGEPKGDMTILLSPRVSIRGKIFGKTADFEYGGGGSGFDTTDSEQPDIARDFDGMLTAYENFLRSRRVGI